MDKPQLWLLAGGNGAGKSTFYELYLKKRGIPFVNADLIARDLFPKDPEASSYQAARQADGIRSRYLLERKSFCFETVFSHPSKVDFVAQAKALHYEIILVFIHLESTELNCARVAQRVSTGGHDVPPDKIEARVGRLLQHVRTVVPLCDEARFLDNSRLDTPFLSVATVFAGTVQSLAKPTPDWASYVLGYITGRD